MTCTLCNRDQDHCECEPADKDFSTEGLRVQTQERWFESRWIVPGVVSAIQDARTYGLGIYGDDLSAQFGTVASPGAVKAKLATELETEFAKLRRACRDEVIAAAETRHLKRIAKLEAELSQLSSAHLAAVYLSAEKTQQIVHLETMVADLQARIAALTTPAPPPPEPAKHNFLNPPRRPAGLFVPE